MDTATRVGFAATLCAVPPCVPQAWKVIRARDTSAISRHMCAITVVGCSRWLASSQLFAERIHACGRTRSAAMCSSGSCPAGGR